MTLTKKELIEMLDNILPENTIIEMVREMTEPPQDNSLIGTTFGSASHLIRAQAETFTENIQLFCRYTLA